MPDPVALTDLSPSDRHRHVAADFGELVDTNNNWDAPTPVPEWVSGDIVEHLLTWFPEFLDTGGIEFPEPSDSADLSARWQHQTEAIQALLDDPANEGRIFAHPQIGEFPLDVTVDRFYTGDVYLHTWDLARAIGHPPDLDPVYATEMLIGMEPMDEMLRSSGHYGPKKPVADSADPVSKIMAFVGRDPNWQPPSKN